MVINVSETFEIELSDQGIVYFNEVSEGKFFRSVEVGTIEQAIDALEELKAIRDAFQKGRIA